MAFTPVERARLLVEPRLGPVVIERLEQAGLDSISKLKAIGVDAAILLICARTGSIAWANRRRPLLRAIAAIVAIEESCREQTASCVAQGLAPLRPKL